MRHVDLNICSKTINCSKCSRYLSLNHVCIDERWCKNCKAAVPMSHMCCIKTQEQREERKPQVKKFDGFVFFDYECMNVDGFHKPNMIIAQKMCTKCTEEWKTLECGNKSFNCIGIDCGCIDMKIIVNFVDGY